MATKKQNRRGVVRKARRALNGSLDFFKGASKKRLNSIRYGGGLKRSDVRERKECDE